MSSRSQAAEKRRSAWDRFVIAWVVAVIPNTLDGFGVELDGGWYVLRLVLSTLALIALLALIIAFVRERRAPPEPVDG